MNQVYEKAAHLLDADELRLVLRGQRALYSDWGCPLHLTDKLKFIFYRNPPGKPLGVITWWDLPDNCIRWIQMAFTTAGLRRHKVFSSLYRHLELSTPPELNIGLCTNHNNAPMRFAALKVGLKVDFATEQPSGRVVVQYLQRVGDE